MCLLSVSLFMEEELFRKCPRDKKKNSFLDLANLQITKDRN